ncbi:DnaJ homolog subfamily C member 13 [Geodia barretti]|uniref:DnaJ homolog subfamily C member 13 n=1 Tax=Geodia barretti TaxID=519541 RepID=A0AA35WJC6_GEOBA|nr:DnaJ homolog subfamily C member 13 [Geodia barretti]
MQPMHDNYDLRQEQMNKSSLLSSKPFLEMVLEPLKTHVQLGTGALVVSSILDFFTFAVCPPYSETTEAEKFDMVLELISGLGRTVFKLFQHPSLAIVKAAGLIMKAIIEEGTPEMAKKMQDLALAEGALPRHLHTSLFTASSDNRLLTHRAMAAKPSTAAEKALQKIQDQVTCGICLEPYKQPRLLKCFHVYCEQCLQRLVRGGREGQSLPCPQCRQDTPLPVGGVPGLQGAFYIHYLFDIQDALKKVCMPALQGNPSRLGRIKNPRIYRPKHLDRGCDNPRSSSQEDSVLYHSSVKEGKALLRDVRRVDMSRLHRSCSSRPPVRSGARVICQARESDRGLSQASGRTDCYVRKSH